MTKFLIKWKINRSMIPEDPEMRVKLWLSMLEMVKTNLKSGLLLDWGEYGDMSGGYAIVERSGADLLVNPMKWIPYILFDAKPVLNVDQVIAAIRESCD